MRISDWSSDVCSSDLTCHEGVGEAVETVAAQPLAPRTWQRQHLLDPGHGVMECGVEAGDLRQLRVQRQQRLDRLQCERLVQRRQRDVAAQVGEHRGIDANRRSEEHTSELQSLMRISYAVFCLQKTTTTIDTVVYVRQLRQLTAKIIKR